MRWRRRYGEMAFEPFGIALPQPLAKRLGIRPVQYGESGIWGHCRGENDLWVQEGEWRLAGKLDLSSILREILVIVPWQWQQRFLKDRFNLETIALFHEKGSQ